MLQLAATLLLSSPILPCFAYNTINVYFSPTSANNTVSPSLSRFVGLEAFETYGDLVPEAIIGKPYQFLSSESSRQDLLMIGIDYDSDIVSEGELLKRNKHSFPRFDASLAIIPASFPSISMSTSSIPEIMKNYLSIGESFYSSVVDAAESFVDAASVPPYILDTSVIASLQSKAASEFFTTLKNAIAFIEEKKDGDNENGMVRFGSFQFRTLKEMRESVDADVYQMALQYLEALITTVCFQ